ncbi:MAG: rRNA maturation RNase YbeY [Patescibacteria group bacterium]
MEFNLNICNETDFSIDKDKFIFAIKLLLKKCDIKANEIKIDLNIVFARNIAKINKKYRKINDSTDVLSFSYINDRDFVNSSKNIIYLGEIFIAPDVIKKNAEKYETVFEQELSRVLIHGLLHLFGYEHEGSRKKCVEMEQMEKSIGLSFKNKKVYFLKNTKV